MSLAWSNLEECFTSPLQDGGGLSMINNWTKIDQIRASTAAIPNATLSNKQPHVVVSNSTPPSQHMVYGENQYQIQPQQLRMNYDNNMAAESTEATYHQDPPPTYKTSTPTQNIQPSQQYAQPTQQYAQPTQQYAQPTQQYAQPTQQHTQPTPQYTHHSNTLQHPAIRHQLVQPAVKEAPPVYIHRTPVPYSGGRNNTVISRVTEYAKTSDHKWFIILLLFIGGCLLLACQH